MKKGLIQGMVVSSLALAMAACSGGGGGSAATGGGGTTGNTATGALAMPSLNCGASACLTSNVATLSTSMNSGEEISAYGSLAYAQFNTVVLPKLNGLLYQLETEFKKLGFETCASIAGIVNASAVALDTTYTVDITTGNMTSPFSGSTSKTFVIKQSGTPVVKLSIGCSTTVRHMYVKAIVDSTHQYEIWTKTDSANTAVKSVEAAADIGTAKLTMQFISSSATEFKLAAAGESYPNPYGSGNINFAMYGQANLGSTPRVAHVAYTSQLNTAAPSTYSANDAAWTGSPIRHCYSNFETGAIDSVGTACSALTGTSPIVSGVRGNTGSITWMVNDLDTALGTSL